MEIESENLIKPDPQTGLLPRPRQLDILLTLNPLDYDRTYAEVGKILGISESNVQTQISRLKKRCPIVYQKFKVLRKKHDVKDNLSLDYEIDENIVFVDMCYLTEDSNYIDISKENAQGYFGTNGEFISFKIERMF